MPIQFRCSGCQKSFSVPDALAGKKAKCTSCGADLTVPLESSAKPATAPQKPAAARPAPQTPASQPAPPAKKPPAAPAVDLPDLPNLDDVGLPAGPPPSTTARPRSKVENPLGDPPPRKKPKKAEKTEASSGGISAGMIRTLAGVLLLVGLGATFVYVTANRQPPRVLGAKDPDAGQQPPAPVVPVVPPSGTNPVITTPVVPVTPPEKNSNPTQPQPGKSPLEGKWAVPDDEDHGGLSMTFFPDRVVLSEKGREQQAKYKVDDTKDPKWLDLIITTPNGQQNTIRAIYEVTSDELKLCSLKDQGRDRPEVFDEPGSETLFLKRPGKEVPGPYPTTVVGRQIRSITDSAFAFAPNKNLAAMEYVGNVILWDADTNRKAGQIRFAGAGDISVGALAFNPDGSRLAAAAGIIFGNKVAICDVATGKVLKTAEPGGESVCYSPNGKIVATCGRGVTVVLRNAETLDVLHIVQDLKPPVTSCAFSPNGELLAATGPEDKPLNLIEVASGRVAATLEGSSKKLRAVAFHPQGKLLAVATEDTQKIEFWDVAERKVVKTWDIKGRTSAAGIAFSRDGAKVALGTSPIQIWDFATDQVSQRLTGSLGDGSAKLAFSADGNRLGVSVGNSVLWSLEAAKSAPPPEPVRWPPPLSGKAASDFKDAEWTLEIMLAHINSQRRGQNFLDKGGKPMISWRVALLSHLDKQPLYNRLEFEQPWDSQHNDRLLGGVGKTLTVPSSGKPGFSRFLLATGPGTAHDGGPKPKPIKNGNAILIVVVNDAQAVPAGEPRDFVFNPNDPWAGLPKEGFFAILWSDRAVFIKPDTTPEQLKALFTVDGETVDIEKVTTGLYERFLWPE